MRKTPLLPKWIYLLVIAMSLSLAWGNSFTNQFVYDDVEFVVRNGYVKDLSLWPRYFTSVTTQSEFVEFSHYRPLTTLSFALNYAANGLNPLGYHLVNFAFHFLNVVLVFWLIRSLTDDYMLALAAALFWGLHPGQTEAVSWIAGRANVMSAAFFLVSILAYRLWQKSSRRLRWGCVLLLAYLGSLLSKEMAVILPLLLIFLDFYDGRLLALKHSADRWMYAALLSLGGIFWLVRIAVVRQFAMPDVWSRNPLVILSTMSRVMGRYFLLLLWPRGLRVDYQFPVTTSLLRLDVVVMLVVLFVLLFLTFYLSRKRPVVSLGLGWFFVNILPVSNIIPFQVIIAERFLYLPSLGFALLLAYLVGRPAVWSKNLSYAVIAIICLVYAGLTFQQNKTWRNEFTLFQQVTKYEPANSKAHYGLGSWHLKKGELDLAIKELKVSIELDKDNYLAYNNLGAAYKFQRKYNLAIPNFQQALELKRSLTEAYFNLADSYAALRDFAKVAEVLETVEPLTPGNPQVYHMLTLAYLELGALDKARRACEEFVRLRPDDPEGQFLIQMVR